MNRKVYLSCGTDKVCLGSLEDVLSIHDPEVSLDVALCQDTFRSWLLDLIDVAEFHNEGEPVQLELEIN